VKQQYASQNIDFTSNKLSLFLLISLSIVIAPVSFLTQQKRSATVCCFVVRSLRIQR